jgi:hypothetical protein
MPKVARTFVSAFSLGREGNETRQYAASSTRMPRAERADMQFDQEDMIHSLPSCRCVKSQAYRRGRCMISMDRPKAIADGDGVS